MDAIAIRQKAIQFVKQYRYALLVLLCGLFLLLLPETEEKQQTVPVQEQVLQESDPDLQDALSEILSQIQGAGEVRVLLTQSAGEQTIYQTDSDTSGESARRDTVIISDSDRAEQGLVQQVNPPRYLGAVILCQGADSAGVRLAIVEAVAVATGLTTDKISVLKMK